MPLASPEQFKEQLPAMFSGERNTVRVDATGARPEDLESIKEQIARIMMNPPRRSGAGPTGMRYEHLKPLAESPQGLAFFKRL